MRLAESKPHVMSNQMISKNKCSFTNKQVRGVVDAHFEVDCAVIKKNGKFKLASMLNLKLGKKPVECEQMLIVKTC